MQFTEASLTDPISSLYSALGSSEAGLTTEEVGRRLLLIGPNESKTREPHPVLKEILFFFSNPLVVILLFAAGVSASLGGVVDASLIFAMVLVSVILNVIQSYRSRLAVEALQRSMSPTAAALRDGKFIEVLRRDIVPGDVVLLNAGDLVPADGRLISANNLHVQQAALTGESLPVDKHAEVGAIASELPSENTACVYLGTSVVSGVGTALVVRTGNRTEFGDIALRLAKKAPITEFERGLRQFGLLILRTVIFLLLFVFLTSIVMKRNPLESLLFSVALAVGLTPEFLPMITTITLSRGAVHMAHLGVIVKNLASIQNFGSMDVLCSDKTGTLTTGEMTFESSLGPLGEVDPSALQMAQINCELQTGIESTLDQALLRAMPTGSPLPKLGEVPFDFERRRMSVIAEIGGVPTLICKGAPESVLRDCTRVLIDGESQVLSAEFRERATQKAEALGTEGYRVLAVATRQIESKQRYAASDESNLKLVGFLTFVDPPLPDALKALDQLHRAGITVKIISGDNQMVTSHICREVGLDPGKIVLGEEIESMTDAALQHVAETRSVFARVSPSQKNRIILALKARGHVVGYMGDGINDAPSLHAADVGISVSTAVEVAKDAAEIILIRPGLEALLEGVTQGRMAFGNVMKYLMMGTSSNFGNMFSMAAATLFLPFLPMLPTQILLNNFLYDLSQVTIPTDRVDPAFVVKPKHWDIGLIRNFMLYVGPLSSIYDFLTFWVLLSVFKAGEKEFHTGWFVESLATQVLVILVIRTYGVPWKSRPSPALLWTTLVIVACACALPYSPLGPILGFVPLPAGFFGFLALATITYLTLVEFAKRRLLRPLSI